MSEDIPEMWWTAIILNWAKHLLFLFYCFLPDMKLMVLLTMSQHFFTSFSCDSALYYSFNINKA